MTFDLHASKEKKAEEYSLWVKRIHNVAITLSMPHQYLWTMTEHEFLMYESFAIEELDRKKQARQPKEGV